MTEPLLSSLLDSPLPRIENARLILFRLPLKSAFETSFGAIERREIIVCELETQGLRAYGECAADEDPLYSYETTATAWQVMERYLLPELPRCRSIGQFLQRSGRIRGHNMAKATVEGALWDLLARITGVPLYRLWGGTKDRIPCGVSVGLQKDDRAQIDTVAAYLRQGYARIKVKIKPGRDRSLLECIRRHFPDIPLMADANAAYSLEDTELLAGLDCFSLMMLEQPLHHEDLYEHSLLQKHLRTPICLDESIVSARAASTAIAMGACRIINIKTGRLGGHAESIRVHNTAQAACVPVWCGGMLESGIGRAHNLALASLPGFTLPGDTSASDRYWHRDIIDPPVQMSPQGYVQLPEDPGIGYRVDEDFLNSLAIRILDLPG